MGCATVALATPKRGSVINCYSFIQASSFAHFRGPCFTRSFHACQRKYQQHKHPAAHALDPRLSQFGRVIENEHSAIRDDYGRSSVCEYVLSY